MNPPLTVIKILKLLLFIWCKFVIQQHVC